MATAQLLIDQLQNHGRRIYSSLQAEIARMESQLEALQDQMSRWRGALSGGGAPRGRGRSAAAPGAKGARKKIARRGRPVRRSPSVDWDTVLKRVPKTFTMDDIAKRTPKLAKFPRARIMAVARWSRGKEIKKLADGKYRKR
jgi:hypothetical protein